MSSYNVLELIEDMLNKMWLLLYSKSKALSGTDN